MFFSKKKKKMFSFFLFLFFSRHIWRTPLHVPMSYEINFILFRHSVRKVNSRRHETDDEKVSKIRYCFTVGIGPMSILFLFAQLHRHCFSLLFFFSLALFYLFIFWTDEDRFHFYFSFSNEWIFFFYGSDSESCASSEKCLRLNRLHCHQSLAAIRFVSLFCWPLRFMRLPQCFVLRDTSPFGALASVQCELNARRNRYASTATKCENWSRTDVLVSLHSNAVAAAVEGKFDACDEHFQSASFGFRAYSKCIRVVVCRVRCGTYAIGMPFQYTQPKDQENAGATSSQNECRECGSVKCSNSSVRARKSFRFGWRRVNEWKFRI